MTPQDELHAGGDVFPCEPDAFGIEAWILHDYLDALEAPEHFVAIRRSDEWLDRRLCWRGRDVKRD